MFTKQISVFIQDLKVICSCHYAVDLASETITSSFYCLFHLSYFSHLFTRVNQMKCIECIDIIFHEWTIYSE